MRDLPSHPPASKKGPQDSAPSVTMPLLRGPQSARLRVNRKMASGFIIALRRRRLRLVERQFRARHHGGEGLGLADREIGQDLAVEVDPGELYAMVASAKSALDQ